MFGQDRWNPEFIRVCITFDHFNEAIWIDTAGFFQKSWPTNEYHCRSAKLHAPLEKRPSQYTDARRWFQLWTLQVSHQKRFIRTLSCIHCEYQLSGPLPYLTRCLQPSSKGETLFCNLCASPVAAACPNVDTWTRFVNKFNSNSFSNPNSTGHCTQVHLATLGEFLMQSNAV